MPGWTSGPSGAASPRGVTMDISAFESQKGLLRRPQRRCTPLVCALSLWATVTTVLCALTLGYFAQHPYFAPWNSAKWWESSHPWTTEGWDVQPVVLVLRPGLSTDSFQRYDADYSTPSADGRRQLAQGDAAHIKAGGVTKLMVDGEPKYEVHSELTAAQMFGEYVENSGAVSKYTYRLRIKQLSTGHQATVTPFGLNMQSVVRHLNDTLSPTFFHFGFKPHGAAQSVSTFVSTSTGKHAFHYSHGETEWKAFMEPFLTTYWAAMVKDYNLRDVVAARAASRRQLTWEDDVAGAADDAINWGEGEVNSWAGSEAGAAGADVGEAVGSKVGGYVGEAAGSAIAGPVGAAVGAEVGSWAGGEAGSYFGKEYGSELGSDVASDATSAIGDSLKSSINSWAASSDASSDGGGFSYSG